LTERGEGKRMMPGTMLDYQTAFLRGGKTRPDPKIEEGEGV